MRNAVVTALVVFFLVVAGGGVITWFVQASAAKKSVEQAIAQANQNGFTLTYDSLATSGFPTALTVSIVKPHFTGRIDPIAKAFLASMPNPDVQNMPEWDVDVALDGNVDLSVNFLSDHYTMNMSGNFRSGSKIGGQAEPGSESVGSSTCSVQIQHPHAVFGILWNFELLAQEGADLPHNLRMVDCVIPAHTMTDAASKEVLMNHADSRIYVTSAPSGNQQQLRIVVKMGDTEVTPAGDKWFAAYSAALVPHGMPPHLSVYGKQNLDLDVTYNGPSDWQAHGADTPLDINISKFSLNSQVSKSDLVFHFSNTPSNGSHTGALSFKATTSVTEQYDALMQELVHNFINDLYTSTDPQLTALRESVQGFKPDDLYSIVSPAIPSLHSLGTLVQAVDVSFQLAPGFSSGDINLAGLEFSASPYGITAKGTATRTAGQPMPAVDMSFACNNCLKLVDDIVDYTGRVQKVVVAIHPEKAAALTIDPALVDGIKGLMGALALPNNGADKTTLNYTITTGPTASASAASRWARS